MRFVVNHEEDSHTWVASTPIGYFERWLSGEAQACPG